MRRLARHGRLLALGWLLLLCAVAGANPATAEQRALHAHAQERGVACDRCHSTRDWKFDFGRAASDAFDHAFTGFPLTGRHLATTCLACHAGGLHPSRACNACHADEHDGRLGQDCDRCHNAQSFDLVSGFRAHRGSRLPLSGMHALLECSACHAPNATRFAETPPSECWACHRADYELHTVHPPHRPQPGNPNRPGFPHDCRQCHNALAWSPALLPSEAKSAVLALGLSRREHRRSFPIDSGAHRSAECADCHAGGTELGAAGVQCVGCHAHAAARLARSHPALPAERPGVLCLSCHARGRR
jgi:hypothetical protein